jgi:hypothetical protein
MGGKDIAVYKNHTVESLQYILEDCRQAAICGLMINNPKVADYMHTIALIQAELWDREQIEGAKAQNYEWSIAYRN